MTQHLTPREHPAATMRRDSVSDFRRGYRDAMRVMRWCGADRINDMLTAGDVAELRPSVTNTDAYLNGWGDAIMGDTFRLNIVTRDC